MPKIIDNSVVGKRSIQNLSCIWTGSADFGRIVPFQWNELLGTDKVETCHPRIEIIAHPLASPTFGEFDAYIHYFFVPTRLLVDGYRDFMNNDGAYKNIEMPYMTKKEFRLKYAAVKNRGLFKHLTSMGLPPFFELPQNMLVRDDQIISLLPFRAYRQIWWDYYRDPEVYRDDNKSDFLDTSYGLQDSMDRSHFAVQMSPLPRMIKDNWIAELFAQNGSEIDQEFTIAQCVANDAIVNNDDSSVNLRKVEALTRFAERMSMSGKRSIDMLFARYGVKPEWDKLNMCQYVGGAKAQVGVQDLVSTSDTQGFDGLMGSPLGAQAGRGYCAIADLNVQFEAHEPGYLMGLVSIMPRVHYVQGLSKEWNRRYREDFFTKHLEHTGQVAVSKYEIATAYATLGNADQETPVPAVKIYDPDHDMETFAFTEPYYEYKRGVDILAGDFMYYHNTALNDGEPTWRDVQYMQSMEMFIDYPLDRTYDVQSLEVDPVKFNKVFSYVGGGVYSDADDHFHINVRKNIEINRPMDGYAVPTIETTEDPHATKVALQQSAEL